MGRGFWRWGGLEGGVERRENWARFVGRVIYGRGFRMADAYPLHRPIRDCGFAAVDFESAGALRGHTDVPVQIGLAVMDAGSAGSAIPADGFLRSFLCAARPIAWCARKVHGITDADIGGAPPLLSLWTPIAGRLAGRCPVAHGAGTERRFLRAFPLHGFGPWVDTLKLAHAAFPDARSHALGALVESLGLKPELDGLCPGLRWHDALYDAAASLVLLRHLIRAGGLGDAPLETLVHPDRAAYYRRRSEMSS